LFGGFHIFSQLGKRVAKDGTLQEEAGLLT
jgi:hypothetical protein